MVALIEVKNFGGIDADADALLEACFEDHEAYLAARDHERFLITGRKGSGKTAIFKKFLRSQSHDIFSFGHTFSDYPWQHHDRQKKIGVPEEQCYLHSWEYLILLTLSKILLNYDQSQPWSEAATENMSRLENFVIDTYGSRDPDVSQIFLPTTKIHITPHFDLDLGLLKAGLSAEQLPMAELGGVARLVENWRTGVSS